LRPREDVKGAFLLERFVTSFVVMAFVALTTFALIDLAPGSFVDELATNPQISQDTLARLRVQYGLDRPFYEKFWRWGRGVVQGDFGDSFVYQRPVRQLVAERLWNTVRLNLVALAVAWTLGVGLGLAAAASRGSALDWAITAVTTLLLSTPVVVLAIVLLACAARVGASLGSLSLPVAAVAAVWMPAIARHTRAAVLAALAAPHMLAARARGVGPWRLLLIHAIRDATIPLTSLFGLSVAALLSASLPVEVVMSWPGIGQLTFDAVIKRDIFLVVDLVQLSALLLLAANTVGDLLLHALDPRIAES
jgi:peptide/nickel transport system permease protein